MLTGEFISKTLLILLLLLGIFIISYGISAWKEKKGSSILMALSLLILSGILSLGFNATPLLATAEYSKFSTRGRSELKLQPDGIPKEQSSGLEYDYITEYSYGIFESLNLFVPRIQGGGSSENLGKDHGVYDFLRAWSFKDRPKPYFNFNGVKVYLSLK